MHRLSLFLLTLALATTISGLSQTATAPKGQEYTVLEVPGTAEYTHIDTNGISVLPSGRLCSPAGRTITLTHDPFGMAISPNGATTVTLHVTL